MGQEIRVAFGAACDREAFETMVRMKREQPDLRPQHKLCPPALQLPESIVRLIFDNPVNHAHFTKKKAPLHIRNAPLGTFLQLEQGHQAQTFYRSAPRIRR